MSHPILRMFTRHMFYRSRRAFSLLLAYDTLSLGCLPVAHSPTLGVPSAPVPPPASSQPVQQGHRSVAQQLRLHKYIYIYIYILNSQLCCQLSLSSQLTLQHTVTQHKTLQHMRNRETIKLQLCCLLKLVDNSLLRMLMCAATDCNRLQQTATDRNRPQHIHVYLTTPPRGDPSRNNMMQHATHCNTLHSRKLQHTATYCNTIHLTH